MDTITVYDGVLAKGKKRILRRFALRSSKPNQMVLRPYQAALVLGHLANNRFTLTESPTGSGKSCTIICSAAEHFRRHKKAVVITPQLGINEGFTKYTADHGVLFECGGQQIRTPRGFVATANTNKVDEVAAYLTGDWSGLFVCTYQAFKLALERHGLDEILTDTVVYVDEGHHSQYEEDETASNQLGALIALCQAKCAKVHIFTATAFRTNGKNIVNGDFIHFRRTLMEHYLEGFCPDFGVYVRFYDKVRKPKFDELEEDQRKLGSIRALIDGYLREYSQCRLPTTMFVDTPRQAQQLQLALRQRFRNIRLLNLGSEDGKTLESQKPDVAKKLRRLGKNNVDVVIAIRLMNEGSDWPDCAQTFSPRISNSVQLLMQRAIGRALRAKREGHPSPEHSRVVLFEIGIRDEDKNIVATSLFELAVRLKALCDGIEFADRFAFRLPEEDMEAVDRQKTQLRNDTNQQLNGIVLQKLLRRVTAGDSPAELLKQCVDLYADQGIKLSPLAALELLVETQIVDRGNEELEALFSQRNASRLNRRLNNFTFAEFSELFREELTKLRLHGVEDLVGVLSGQNNLARISELLRNYTLGTASLNKRKLLELAKAGAKRPLWTSQLGRALNNYTNKSTGSYDRCFDKEIRQLAPSWLRGDSRAQLLQLAKDDQPRPHHRTRLGNALSRLLSEAGFRASIEELAPQWLERAADLRKREFLRLAETGQPKPKTPLLAYYIRTDQAFRRKLKRLVPDWLIRPNPNKKKLRLLTRARAGNARPHGSTPLYNAFLNFTTPGRSGYDQGFDKELHSCAPGWFKKPSSEKKRQLIELAKANKPRPECGSELSRALSSYTKPHGSSYDAAFTKLIKKLVPYWFLDRDSASNKKTQLLRLAQAGDTKPPSRTILGRACRSYIYPTSNSYDCEFVAKLRILAPNWLPGASTSVAWRRPRTSIVQGARNIKPANARLSWWTQERKAGFLQKQKERQERKANRRRSSKIRTK